MLKLSKKVDYALLSLEYIENISQKGVANSREISSHYRIPSHLLSKVLQQLVKGNILESQLGVSGGYRLVDRMEELSVAKLIHCIEGGFSLAHCVFEETSCDQIQYCTVQEPIQMLAAKVWDVFENTKVSELIQKEKKEEEVLYA